ncbi:MAG: permease-like cell division protein FtsX [Oligoflexia bacterium]|nr:permease-like cell division protein FtsX [Oligoflexia bacterium]
MSGGMAASNQQTPRVGLKAIWTEVSTLPHVARKIYTRQLVERAFINIVRAPMTSLLTLFTTSFALFVFAIFVVAVQQFRAGLVSSQRDVPVTVYLKEAVSEDQARALAVQYQRDAGVASARVVDKKMALEEFRSALAEQRSLLDGLDERNPLPISIEVKFASDVVHEEAARKFANVHGDEAAVEFISYSHSMAEQLSAFLSALRLGGALAIVVILVMTAFIMMNTIKLALYAHREEIEIMRLVGATDAYIRTPYLIEGVLQGLAGAVVSMLVLGMAGAGVNHMLAASDVIHNLVPNLTFLTIPLVLLVLSVGAAVGFVGSYLAVRKFSVD